MDKYVEFQDYVNSLGGGYLKAWKANGILNGILGNPLVAQDNSRMSSYLDNCLLMEGFHEHDVEKIQRWLIDNVL